MKRIARIALFSALLVSLVSCGAYKRLGYLQDMEEGIEYSVPTQPEPIISKGDRLNIIVTCPNPEVAAPFNVMNGIYASNESVGSGVTVAEEAAASDLSGFEVNDEGKIIYPVLGALPVDGLTLKQVQDTIETKLISSGLIREPKVLATFSNFKIIILGESNKNSVLSVPEGKIDIFEALAQTSDLTEDAVRNEVWVIRTRENTRKLYKINLKSKDCYYSPAFYLQQNDMVYVKPENRKFDKTTQNRWTVFNTTISTLNFLLWISRIFVQW